MQIETPSWKRYYESHKSECNARAKMWASAHPNKVREIAKRHRTKYAERYKRADTERNRRLRAELLEAYGAVCACCQEQRTVFLTLNHKNGGGTQHRRRVGEIGVYRELKRLGWPRDQYEILCMNCNWARRYGACPHEQQEEPK